jgi:hypothetical protein
MKKRFALGFLALLTLQTLTLTLAGSSWAGGRKPEDVFAGRIIITKKRLPLRFSSSGAFVEALQAGKTDRIWPTTEDGPDKGTWDIEYIAFFSQPLNDSEIEVKFFDITSGKKYVAGDPQYTREKGSRIFGSSIQLSKPDFDVRKHYMMTVESRGRIIATTAFWLLGKGANYSGKVEFSDDDAKGH